MSAIFHLWLYGAASVIFISIVGFCCIVVIPMVKNHHGNIIQMLVGLAIGTLTSDALLHLLPHAFNSHKPHSDQRTNLLIDNHNTHTNELDHLHNETLILDSSIAKSTIELDSHLQNVYYGLMTLIGIIGFLIIERAITIISDICHNSKRKTSKIANIDTPPDKITQPNLKKDALETDKLTIDTIKLNNEKSASIISSKENGYSKINSNHHHDNNHIGHNHLDNNQENNLNCREITLNHNEPVTDLNLTSDTNIQLTTEQCHKETILYPHPNPDKGFVVQLTEHHHHHQHHNPQGSAKSVIMMIVTGDGLHNFFDGLAIGISFATGGIGGGISTSIAILCHELPHEVGDFAVLLSAGLSVKRAMMYNALSAVLCFIGMSVGIGVGGLDTGFLSALIAGMFLYIALVNMIPQLDCCPMQSSGHRALKLSIQVAGICIGVAIMCIVSIYEDKIQNLLGN